MAEHRGARDSRKPGPDWIIDCFFALLISLIVSLVETDALTRVGQDPASTPGANGMVALMMMLTAFPLLLMGQAVLLGAWLRFLRR